jgi:flagellar basal-body rod modification protein FlgD
MIPTVPFTSGSSLQQGTTVKRPDEMGREEFTRLLIAQLKNQDPLEPLSSTEFMNQLTQLSNLEQLMAVKTKLDGLDNMQQSLRESQALSHLGKEVLVSSSEIRVSSGQVETLEYELVAPAETVTVSIFDSTGRLVFTKSESEVSSGVNQVGWEGKDSGGHLVGDGIYLVQVSWTNGADAPTPVPTQLRGVVEAITHNALGEPLLKVGNRAVSLASVRQVGELSTGQ